LQSGLKQKGEWRNYRWVDASSAILATAPEGGFQLLVVGLTGKTSVVDVGQGARVGVLQDYVYRKEGIPKELQVLTAGSKVLLGHQRLVECGLHHLSTVTVRLRIRGGDSTHSRDSQRGGA
jgi:predicted methyltransferase MtxX (methanogen marker protein 4)